eukprot:COSAG03_NODE_1707_length_3621_cov_33.777399_5_plen_170_part_00
MRMRARARVCLGGSPPAALRLATVVLGRCPVQRHTRRVSLSLCLSLSVSVSLSVSLCRCVRGCACACGLRSFQCAVPPPPRSLCARSRVHARACLTGSAKFSQRSLHCFALLDPTYIQTSQNETQTDRNRQSVEATEPTTAAIAVQSGVHSPLCSPFLQPHALAACRMR